MEKECNNQGHWKISGKGRRRPHLTCLQTLAGILMVCLGGPPKFQCRNSESPSRDIAYTICNLANPNTRGLLGRTPKNPVQDLHWNFWCPLEGPSGKIQIDMLHKPKLKNNCARNSEEIVYDYANKIM